MLSDAASRCTAFLKLDTEGSGVKSYLCLMACSARDLAWISLSVACFSSFANACVILERIRLRQRLVYLLRQRRLVDDFPAFRALRLLLCLSLGPSLRSDCVHPWFAAVDSCELDVESSMKEDGIDLLNGHPPEGPLGCFLPWLQL